MFCRSPNPHEKVNEGDLIMVGFDPAKTKLTNAELAAAGALSSAMTRFFCQPLDVVKIRFQLQVEPIDRKHESSKYWSVTQATRSIVKEEGLFALWKGHVPAQLLSVVYGLTQFMTFEMLTQEVWHLVPFLRHDTYKPVVHFLCGGIAGSLATILSFPSDVVRTRLVAQGEPKVYKNLPQAISMIYRIEGPRAFFKGLSPTIVQVTPHAGVQFSAYSIFTSMWKEIVQLKGTDAQYIPISGVGSLVCGSLSGICAKTAVYPFDLARKRLQIQGFQHARKGFGKPFICHGLIECLVTTIREEKMIGLFKGLWPSLLKAAVTTALHFYIYEQTCHAIAATHSLKWAKAYRAVAAIEKN